MKLAVIPARGGSKRIPRKNIRLFAGKPIIAYSIEAALASGCFDEVIVSTDDSEIADIAKGVGASVPFVRPPVLSDDFTGTNAVVKHAIEWFNEQGQPVSHACCIYATAPFVTSAVIQEGWRILNSAGDLWFAMTVTSFPFAIQRALRKTDTGRLDMFYPEHLMTRSQDLEEAYHDAGQLYWGLASAFVEDRRMFDEHSAPIILPRNRVQDIDTLEDWEHAELLYRAWQQKGLDT